MDNSKSKGSEPSPSFHEKSIDTKTESSTTAQSSTAPKSTSVETEFVRDARFWLIFLSLCSVSLLSALDLGGIGTAGPTIVHALNGQDFTWIASAYALSSSCTILLSGNLAEIFGRKAIITGGVLLFGIGSAICGSAKSMAMLIGAVQGAGGGAIQSLTSIIVSDLVPLRDRGTYSGITGLVWTVGTTSGPFIAGGFSQDATWRWLFYINLPLAGLALTLVLIFLRMKAPTGSFRQKIVTIDWIGNIVIIASTCACLLALTWGGVKFPWSSPRIIAPLVLGVVGFVAALFYESRWPTRPVIPIVVLSNRTSLLGYIQSFIQGMTTLSVTFYLPTWFQAVKSVSPVLSAVYVLPLVAMISPFAIVQGVLIGKTGRYRLLNAVGWSLLLLGLGLLISCSVSTSIGLIVLYQLLMGVGMGVLYSLTFPVLSPLPLALNGPAVALLTFMRVFSQVWGVTVGGAILQNELKRRLPGSILSQIHDSEGQLAYSIVPLVRTLPPNLKFVAENAFLDSLRILWITLTACCAVGLLCFVWTKNYPLRQTVDGKWAIDRRLVNTQPQNSAGEPGPTNKV
ncbi:hypothetical protein GALMADRAFT_232386 [Galerina marginata CBS 339.88]|uniref:Major facilitator superfamily (MFS) profile domain-containing protein n=1 Tax=Galerina marginata (strain CBS 339.88) TaxID=685588 RepID=A0A067S9Q4_GALM3|nr:hypothetical protein GALMADRAFT_232386 [Galerina marginata CBS 339.88]